MKHLYLIGDPVAHSLSPAMHNAAFQALGLDWHYEALQTTTAQLPDVVARLRASDCVGANVTVPHKETIISFLDALTDRAQRAAAVNTVVRQNGRLVGDNTDGEGFLQMLRRANVDARGAQVLILGAGGAARGVAFALAELPVARLAIVNRTPERAEKLAHDMHAHFPRLGIEVGPDRADIIVNATSVGMSPRENESPVSGEFPRDAVAIDLVYRPLHTRFLRDAERVGARTVDGLPMLVYQGAAAFALWTRRAAPIDVMREVAYAAISNGG